MDHTDLPRQNLAADAPDRPLFPLKKAFVLRFSAESGPVTGRFAGRIEHVSSGQTASFRSPEELWAFVRAELVGESQPVAALPPSSAERPQPAVNLPRAT